MKNTENYRSDEDNRLDERFRERLKDYQPEPSNRIWKGIDRKLLIRELLRFNFTNISRTFWIGGAAIIVITGTILLITLPGKKEIPPVSGTVKEQLHPQKTPVPGLHTSPTTKRGSETKNAFVRPYEKVPSSTEKINPSSTKEQQGNKEISNSVKPVNTQPGKMKPIALSTLKANTGPVKNPAQKINADETAEPTVNKNSQLKSINQEKTDNFTTTFKNNVPASITVQPASPEKSRLYVITPRKASLYGFGQPGPDSLQSIGSSPIPEEKKTRIPLPVYFSLGLGITPEISFYKTTSNYNNYDYWLGIDFAYHFGRFYIKPGISWGMVNDHGNYMVSYKRQDSVGFYYHVTSYTIDPQDPTKVIYNYTAQAILDSINHVGNEKASNRYQYFQVPMLLGFNLVETPRFSLAMQAGPGVSLLVSQKETHVEMIQLTNSTVIERVNQTPSRVTLNWQLWAGLHMEYRIKEMFSVMVEPTFKYYLAPVSDNSTTPSKAPWVIGINIGLQYNFGFKNNKK
jgi:hypothetical protein